jgi:alkylation response protein AidB-like acyl-CoA dehydrogenase
MSETLVRERIDALLAHDPADRAGFLGAQYDLGLAWVHFPEGAGGLAADRSLQTLVHEAVVDVGGPHPRYDIGYGMGAPTIVACGTPEQSDRWLRPLFTTAEVWCQLFSEPGAGSDVAGLATRAVRDGDEWVVNGQKVWTSGAHYCDHGIVVARTDPTLPKHQGLTMFIVDMHDPGVEVRPLRQISGASGFNEVFFTDLRIPADAQLGDLNQGWNLAVAMLMFERVSIGAGGGALNAKRSPRLIKLARTLGRDDDPVIRQGLADLWIKEEIKDYIGRRIRTAVAAGRVPGPEGSIAKLNGAIIARTARDVTMDLVGASGQAWMADDPSGAVWATTCVSVAGVSIAGGTDEVQRNIIGERVLGLPKEPDPYKGAAWEDVPRS